MDDLANPDRVLIGGEQSFEGLKRLLRDWFGFMRIGFSEKEFL